MAQLSNEDIELLCRLYREAADKDKQVIILSQVFATPKYGVEEILRSRGLIGDAKGKLYSVFRELYVAGKTDYQIALICKAELREIRYWRILNELTPNIYKEDKKRCTRKG